MGETFITRRGGGGKPKPPANWTFLQLITSNMTWTVPNDGWYKIYCVGKSGDGGAGGGMKNGDSDDYAGNGGSGGSSGGVAISSLLLKMGTVIPVTVNTFITSFGSYFSATGGARGNDGADGPAMSDAPAPTEVGHGMGGNIVNYAGLQGGAGGHRGPSRFVDGSSGQSVNGNTGGPFTGSGSNGSGGGGSGNNLQGLELYYKFVDKVGGGANANAWSAPPVLASPPVFYGSGGGGGGVRGNGLTEDGDTSTTGKRPGGLGSPGGIIIEKGA